MYDTASMAAVMPGEKFFLLKFAENRGFILCCEAVGFRTGTTATGIRWRI